MIRRRGGRVAVTVLYEDSRSKTGDFGLHRLVVACVFDLINGLRHQVEGMVEDRPQNGAPKLLQACREDIADLACDGRSVVAVFDEDRIRRQLGLPPQCADEDIVREILNGCRAPERLTVVLLRRNLESVLLAARDCDPGLDPGTVTRALGKDPLARDDVLHEIAKEHKREVRTAVLRQVPSLNELVTLLCERLRGLAGQ